MVQDLSCLDVLDPTLAEGQECFRGELRIEVDMLLPQLANNGLQQLMGLLSYLRVSDVVEESRLGRNFDSCVSPGLSSSFLDPFLRHSKDWDSRFHSL